MNSLWGKLFNLIKETSLTWHDLLWKISWVNVSMMIADGPKYGKPKKEIKELETLEDFGDFLKL